jgi:hypothetical protein
MGQRESSFLSTFIDPPDVRHQHISTSGWVLLCDNCSFQFQSKTLGLDRPSMPSSNEHTPQMFTSISREISPSEPSFFYRCPQGHCRYLLHQNFQLQDHPSLHTSYDLTRGLNLLSIIVIIYGYGMSMGHAHLICIKIFFFSSRIVFLQVDLSFFLHGSSSLSLLFLSLSIQESVHKEK